jgi:hypothetical protein
MASPLFYYCNALNIRRDITKTIIFFISETEETMTSLVNSLIDDQHPITADSIDRIEVFNVIEDIKGITTIRGYRIPT